MMSERSAAFQLLSSSAGFVLGWLLADPARAAGLTIGGITLFAAGMLVGGLWGFHEGRRVDEENA